MSSRKLKLPVTSNQSDPATISRQTFIQHAHSGPLPEPAELAAFGQISSDFPERIVRMAEQEQQHRFEVQKQELAREELVARINGRNSLLGLIISLVVVAAVMAAVVLCAYYHQPWPASILGGGGLCAVVATIICGSKIKSGATKQK